MRLSPEHAARARTALVWLGRLALAGTYLVAARPKLLDPAGFAKAIHNYQLLPDGAVNLLAIYLPPLELLTALALLFVPAGRRGALLLLNLMTTVFIVAIGSAVFRGINIDCGCFSTSGQGLRTGWWHIGLDVVLLAIGLLLHREEMRSVRSEPRPANEG